MVVDRAMAAVAVAEVVELNLGNHIQWSQTQILKMLTLILAMVVVMVDRAVAMLDRAVAEVAEEVISLYHLQMRLIQILKMLNLI